MNDCVLITLIGLLLGMLVKLKKHVKQLDVKLKAFQQELQLVKLLVAVAEEVAVIPVVELMLEKRFLKK